jgi:hypothetical protein
MFDTIQQSPTTTTLELALRLKPMSKQTLSATLKSIRKLRRAVTGNEDLEIEVIRNIVANPESTLRDSFGPKASQIFSDVRRALRVWDEPAIQKLALKIEGAVVTCEHAIYAAHISLPPDRAKRAELAIRALAQHLNQSVESLIATETVIEPKLLKLAPEDLQVNTLQSLKNKQTLIRAAIRLVDPARLHGRMRDMTRIGERWKPTLQFLVELSPDHSPSVAAIFRRLAHSFDTEGKIPEDVTENDLAIFIDGERKTHNPSFEGKLRFAFGIWNKAIDDGILISSPFTFRRRTLRLPDVAWQSVPADIRFPVDDLLCKAAQESPEGAWENLIDDELGVPAIEGELDHDNGALSSKPATSRIWRNSIKRVWHATIQDDSITSKPMTIEALYTPQNVRSFVMAVWTLRKLNFENSGKDWESNKKGIYETNLLKTFLCIGKALAVDAAQLEQIRMFVHKIDPAVLGKKRMPDGRIALVFDQMKIGPRHAQMLQAFNEDSVMARWFKASDQLWAEALKGKSRPNGAHLQDVALARSALILRILQRVSPLRRQSIARLRVYGSQPHIHLPIGNGEGRLYLPAIEMKNLRALEVRIDPGTVSMIREFLVTFRPSILARDGIALENEHLFPGAACDRPEIGPSAKYEEGFGYHCLDGLSSTYSQHMRRKCALNVDMHVARHIAAKVILDMDPSAMGLVQEVLEHKRIETTRAYYAAVSKLIAQKRYLALLDKATQRTLGKLNFTVYFENHLRD